MTKGGEQQIVGQSSGFDIVAKMPHLHNPPPHVQTDEKHAEGTPLGYPTVMCMWLPNLLSNNIVDFCIQVETIIGR